LRLEALAIRIGRGVADRDEVDEALTLAGRSTERAEALLRRYLDGDDLDDEGRAWGLATLGERHLEKGEVAGAVELFQRAAALATADTARGLHLRVAALATDPLQDLGLAARAYEALVERDTADREAWEPLLELYRRAGEHRKLADLIGRVLEVVDDPKELSRLRFERVRVMMDELGAGEEVIDALREIAFDDPSQRDATMLLSSIYARTGREDELAELLQRQIEAAKDRADAPQVASLALRLGALLGARDRGAARDAYYTGLDWDPQSADLLRALLASLGDDADASERADVMGRLLPLETGEEAERLALTLAQLRAEMWDEEGAERALEAGYAAHPRSVVLRERLEASYRERGAWDKLARSYVLYARAASDVAEKLARLKEAARLLQAEAGDHDGAASALEEAFALAPGDAGLRDQLVALLDLCGRPEDGAKHITAALDALAPGDPARGSLLVGRARLRARAGDEEGAAEDLDAAHALGAVPLEVALEQRTRLRDALYARGDGERGRVVALALADAAPTGAMSPRSPPSLPSRQPTADGTRRARSSTGSWASSATTPSPTWPCASPMPASTRGASPTPGMASSARVSPIPPMRGSPSASPRCTRRRGRCRSWRSCILQRRRLPVM
jgi:lipopolysaccharide biosynthesis regulator YciM